MTVGFRFHPNDHEIIAYFLRKKMDGHDFGNIIAEIDLCRHEPRELPEISITQDDDRVWYFFCRPDYKYKNSKMANRATRTGFWKPTGKVRSIKEKGAEEEIGTKRTLVFYSKERGSPPVRTSWVIHEYRVKTILPDQREIVFCKLKDKADEQTDNSPTEEGEPRNHVVSEADSQPSPSAFYGEDVFQLLRQPLTRHNDELDLNYLSAMQLSAPIAQSSREEDLWQTNIPDVPIQLTSQYKDSEEEVDRTFVDSLLVDPDENYIVADIHPNDYQSQRTLSKVYFKDVIDADSEVIHEKLLQQVGSSQLPDGHGSPREFRQIRRFQTLTETLPAPEGLGQIRNTGSVSKAILQMSASSMGLQQEKPKPPPPKEPEWIQLEAGRSSAKFKNQAKEATSYGTAARHTQQGFCLESENRRRRVNAIDAKQDLKIGSSETASTVNKTDFIRMQTPTSSSRPSPPLVYLVNVIVGVVVSIIIIGTVLFSD